MLGDALALQVNVPSREAVPRLQGSISREIEVFSVKDESHSSHILQGLYSMFKEERFCDITFVINKKRKLKAHRAVLTAFSSYFEALLGSNWDEGKQDEVELQGIDEAVFTALVEFAYSGRIEITTENVQDLLEGADFFGAEFVQKSCVDFLKAALDEKVCLDILQLAERYSIEDLRSAAKRYVLDHFREVSQEEEFLDLPLLYMTEILREDQLCVALNGIIPTMAERERFVLETVFRYVEHDLENRKAKVPELLACVRLPCLSLSLLEALRNNEVVKDSKESLEVVDRAIALSGWTKPRKLDCIVWKGCIYADDRYVRPEIATFNDEEILVPSESEIFVKGMKLWICRSVLGGMQVFYSNGLVTMLGGDSATEQHEFHIEEDERITKLNVQSGWMIDRLLFYTNKQESGEYYEEVPPGSFGYLAWVRGTVRRNQEMEGITRLQFVWRTFGCSREVTESDDEESYNDSHHDYEGELFSSEDEMGSDLSDY